jgi:hypothetical protein
MTRPGVHGRELLPTTSRRVRRLVPRSTLGGPVWASWPGAADDGVEVEAAVVLDLLDAACAAGASVPGALEGVGLAVGGCRGGVLVDAAAALRLGAPWTEAWADAGGALEPVGAALRPSWDDGVAPAGSLRAVAATLREERRSRAAEAAGRLGVRLVLPLGLCHLPAFVLVGLVPILVSMTSRLG